MPFEERKRPCLSLVPADVGGAAGATGSPNRYTHASVDSRHLPTPRPATTSRRVSAPAKSQYRTYICGSGQPVT